MDALTDLWLNNASMSWSFKNPAHLAAAKKDLQSNLPKGYRCVEHVGTQGYRYLQVRSPTGWKQASELDAARMVDQIMNAYH